MDTLLDNLIDTRSIIEETNKRLIKGFQIDPDDPMVANVILNQVILERYVAELGRELTEHRRQLQKALALEEEAARKVASKVIMQSTDYLVENIQATQKQFISAIQEAQETSLSGQNRALHPLLIYGLVGMGFGLMAGVLLGMRLF